MPREAQADTFAHARAYLKAGWSVIPVRRDDKKPALDSWAPYQRARPGTGEVAAWFGNGADNNVGIVTGRVSGLVVLDVDEKGAAEGLHLPATPCVRTGRGAHYYYRMPDGRQLRNAAKLLGRKLDLRGEGGYVIAPPSVHSSGRRYEWAVSPRDQELADPPDWILEALRAGRGGPRDREGPLREGERNDGLFRAACAMRREGLDEEELLAALRQINARRCKPALSDDEVATIARSATRYEPAGDDENRNRGSGEASDLSEDGLALELGELWSDDARYVDPWGRWYFWAESHWEEDESLLHMTLAREFLRDRAQELEEWAEAKAEELKPEEGERLKRWAERQAQTLRSARTVAQVVGLARSNEIQAASVRQWDADPFRIATPTEVGR